MKIVRFNNNKKQIKRKIGRKILILIIIVFFIFLTSNSLITTSDYIAVEYDYLENKASGIGLVIRNEYIVESPVTGDVIYHVSENERVRANQLVAEINRQTSHFFDINNENLSTEDEYKIIEQEQEKGKIENQVKAIKSSVLDGAIGDAIKINKALLDSNDYDLNVLKGKIKKNNRVSIKAPRPGIVSYNSNSINIIFDELKYIENLNINSLKKLKTKNEKETGKAFSGMPIFKIIDNTSWYLLIEIDIIEEKMSSEKIDNRLNVIIDNNEMLKTGEILDINKKDDKLNILIEYFETFKGFYDKEEVKIDIIYNRTYGLIIPKSALIKKNDLKGVYIKENGTKKFVSIEIVGSAHDHYAIKGIKRGDKVYINNTGG